jgi:uncharacterized glyoxalase superfamily protein PhnB
VSKAKFDSGEIIFISPDVGKTAVYYHDVFGCTVAEHYDNEEQFAALYRDKFEIVVVQSKKGKYTPNSKRYGAGYDAYLDTEYVEGVDPIYSELKQKGAEIAVEPHITPYGSYEFVIKDIDGRLIGIGRIKDNNTFFKGISIK